MPTATDRAHLRATWWGRGAAALALIAALLKVPGLISTWATYAAVRAVVRPGAGVSDDRGVVSVDTGVVADAMASVPRWTVAAWLLPVVVVASTVLLMVWVARVRDDIAAFAPYHRFRFSRRFAVGGLAIPFVNLWFSRRIIDDLWAGRPGPGAWIVRVWRACLVSAILLRVGGSAAVTAVTEGAALEDMLVTHVAVWLMGSIVLTIEVLLVLGAAVSLAVIVRRIDGRRGVLPHAPAAGVGNERSASSSASTS